MTEGWWFFRGGFVKPFWMVVVLRLCPCDVFAIEMASSCRWPRDCGFDGCPSDSALRINPCGIMAHQVMTVDQLSLNNTCLATWSAGEEISTFTSNLRLVERLEPVVNDSLEMATSQ